MLCDETFFKGLLRPKKSQFVSREFFFGLLVLGQKGVSFGWLVSCQQKEEGGG